MDNKNSAIGVSDLLLLVVSVIFLVGTLTFFSACGPKEDGSWMTCHWAGQAVAGLAAVLLLISILHLIVKDAGIRLGLSLALIPASLLAAVLPGNLIGLCMMDTMRCRSVMRPAVIVFSLLMIAAALFDISVQRKRSRSL